MVMNKFNDGDVVVSRGKYEDMESDIHFLECLQAAGVDNWEGYSFAFDIFNERYGDMMVTNKFKDGDVIEYLGGDPNAFSPDSGLDVGKRFVVECLPYGKPYIALNNYEWYVSEVSENEHCFELVEGITERVKHNEDIMISANEYIALLESSRRLKIIERRGFL